MIAVVEIFTPSGKKYAIRYSFLGMFKSYLDLNTRTAIMWWGINCYYYPDCLTEDSEVIRLKLASVYRKERVVKVVK